MPNLRIGEETRAAIAQAWPGLLSRIAAGAIIGRELAALGIGRDSVRAYIAGEPGARREWDEAREASADAYFDSALEIAYSEGGDPKCARVRLAALQWLAAKRNPRVYADRQQVNLDVRTVDLTAIIRDANLRLANSNRRERVIEHDVAAVGLL